MTTTLSTPAFTSRTKGIFSAAMILLLCFYSVFSNAQNFVGIYYNRVFEDPSVKQKCIYCPVLANDLEKSGFHTLERQKMSKIIDEQALSSSGLVKEDSKVASGQVLHPLHFVTVTGLNYENQTGSGDDAMANFSYTDLKTGKISWSKNSNSLPPDRVADFTKLFLNTYSRPVVSNTSGRTLRTVYVSIPVVYDFKFKGVYPKVEQAEETVIQESDEYTILKDGQKQDKKKDVLTFGELSGVDGTYSGTEFTVQFKPSTNSDDIIWMQGKFSADKSKIVSIDIYHNHLRLVQYGDSYELRESGRDVIHAENLVYKKTPMGGQYEFVPGVSKISSIESGIGFYERGDMPKRILTSSHNFKQIDGNRTDPVRGKVSPTILLMTADNTPVSAKKPLKKIYLRGDWPGYPLLTEKLLGEYPAADLIDQTDVFNQKIIYERSLNKETAAPGNKPVYAEQPLAGEAILLFTTQPGDNGAKKITVEVRTAGKSNVITFNQPAPVRTKEELATEDKLNGDIIEKGAQLEANFAYARILALGNLVVKEMNK
jgi:hypothetical protein